MNWIVLEEKDKLIEPFIYKISIQNSTHIRQVLKRINPNEEFRALLPGNSKGNLKILRWENERAIIEYSPNEFLQNKLPAYTIISPLPRPQTGKKIFHLAGAYGYHNIFFYINSSNNREYITSPVYRKGGFKEYIQSGMEQTGNYKNCNFQLLPESPLFNDTFKPLSWDSSIHLVFHPYSKNLLREDLDGMRMKIAQLKPEIIYIHIGSENGWTERELQLFQKNTIYKLYNIGNLVLRSEYATNAILNELEYIRSGY